MEVFDGWDAIVAVLERARANVLVMCYSIAGVAFLCFVLFEIYKLLVEGDRRVLNFGGFARVGLVLLVLFNYAEITEKIGDAFYGIAWQVRAADPTLANYQDEPFSEYFAGLGAIFKLEEVAKHNGDPNTPEVEETEQDMWDTITANIGSVWNFFQDYIANSLMLISGMLISLVRSIMVGVKNLAYFFLMVAGPIPIVLAVIPGLSGYAGHWFKSFLTVNMWGVTIAVLDVMLANTRFLFDADLRTADDKEFTYAFISWMLIVGYILVPYLTSLLVGQTAVQNFGSKVAGVVATAASGAASFVGGAAAGGAAAGSAGGAGAGAEATAAAGASGVPASSGGFTFQTANVYMGSPGGYATTEPRSSFGGGSPTDWGYDRSASSRSSRSSNDNQNRTFYQGDGRNSRSRGLAGTSRALPNSNLRLVSGGDSNEDED